MHNERLNEAVAQLLSDSRLLRRFRRDPARAMSRFGLSDVELAAVKRGDAEELVELGLSPALVWPQRPNTSALQLWVLRNAKRLAPATVMAATALAWAGASPAAARGRPRTVPGLNRARRALAGNGRA